METKKPSIIAYEMRYAWKQEGNLKQEPMDKQEDICNQMKYSPFAETDWEEYRDIYNECYYDMRKSLEIEPYNYLEKREQLEGKTPGIYVFRVKEEMVASIACYGNEADDLFVKKSWQKKGIGRALLVWAMENIRKQGYEEVVLHVAEWNQHAMKMYQEVGFQVTERIVVRE